MHTRLSVLATLVLVAGFSAALSAPCVQAFTPRTGHWLNPDEVGTGYNIDIQDGTLVVTIFSYKPGGDSEWYIASGKMSADQSVFTGELLAIRGGQCISCTYVAPSSTISGGPITISFTSETNATVQLPGGRVTSIQPFNFGFGGPPQGLLGEWVYVENIGGVDFADRYDFTTLLPPSPAGNGIVLDLTKNAFCELQVTGQLAGTVICGHASDATLATLVDIYSYRFGLDQTYDGLWISPTTLNAYPMKGYMSISRSGFSKLEARAESRATKSTGLTQNDVKRQAEEQSASASALASDYAATIAAAAEEQRRAVVGAH